jgi:hypothetical protein
LDFAESCRLASAKIAAIKAMEFNNRHSFYCKHCSRSVDWLKIFFDKGGHPRCKKCSYPVAVDKPKGNSIKTRVHVGQLRVCLKPYPICDAQLMLVRNYKPVIFCANNDHCLKAQLIHSPTEMDSKKIE